MATDLTELNASALPKLAYFDRARAVMVGIFLALVAGALWLIGSQEFNGSILSEVLRGLLLISSASILLLLLIGGLKLSLSKNAALSVSDTEVRSAYFGTIALAEVSKITFRKYSTMGLDTSMLMFEMENGSKKILPVYALDKSSRRQIDKMLNELG
jgi:hypothetical protein